MQALSQLSYGPWDSQSSAELVFLGPTHSLFLIVVGRTKAKRDRAALRERLEWEEVATIEVSPVRGEGVDLASSIALLHEAVRAAAPTHEGHNEHGAAPNDPLALDSN